MEGVFGEILGELESKAPEFLVALGVLLVLVGLGHLFGMAVSRLMARAGRGQHYTRLARRLVRWGFTLFGVLLALQILGYTAVATSVLATGGVAAVVLGFAFKDIGENLLAGLFLAFSRSFDVGDLIESEGLRGVVRSIDLRATHIRTADGCDIFIPSSQIFRQPLLNFTRDGLRRGTFMIGVDYADDPLRALDVMRAAVSGTRGVLADPPPTFQLNEFGGGWMELEANLWIDTRDAEKADQSLAQIRSRAMAATRAGLLDAGFTLSPDTTTAVVLRPVDVRVAERRAEAAPPSHDDSTFESEPDTGA